MVQKILAKEGHSPEVIADLAHKIFTDWLEKDRPKYLDRDHDALMGILGTAIMRDIMDFWKHKELPTEDVENLDLISSPEKLDPESTIILRDAVTRLNPLQKQIYNLWLAGCSIPNIAIELSLTEISAKREWAKIKQALRMAFK